MLVERAVGFLQALALVHVAGNEDALQPGLPLPRVRALAAPGRRERMARTYCAFPLRFPGRAKVPRSPASPTVYVFENSRMAPLKPVYFI